jgi:hypothetical protein
MRRTIKVLVCEHVQAGELISTAMKYDEHFWSMLRKKIYGATRDSACCCQICTLFRTSIFHKVAACESHNSKLLLELRLV